MRVPARLVRAVTPPPVVTDPDALAAVREDASRYTGTGAKSLVRPGSEEEVAAALRAAAADGVPVLAIGAQSSLTGGSTPFGDRVIATDALAELSAIEGDAVWCGPGVRLDRLRAQLAPAGWDYPPVPTYQLACLGGTVATNAAGSATFKYGVTRDWVRALRVLTVEGELLEVERGQYVARAGDAFEIAGRHVPVPDYPWPRVKKCAMGYHSAPEVDLIDLFIGSEGTLGVVTGVKIGLSRAPAAVLAALIFTRDEAGAVELAAALRRTSEDTRAGVPGSALDVRAIEHMDGASLDLVRARGFVERLRVPLPPDARMALYCEIELPAALPDDRILEVLAATLEGRDAGAGAGAGGAAAAQLFALLRDRALLDRLELALPGEPSRLTAFREFREAVPMAVNETIRERQQRDPAIYKLGGDMCVPFECFGELLEAQRRELESRGLEHVIFGHISDGNVHPNVLARTAAEMGAGTHALLAIAKRVSALGGAPLAEHGVGRSPMKQVMLAAHHGPAAMARMRGIKSALDPAWRLARGVLFPAP